MSDILRKTDFPIGNGRHSGPQIIRKPLSYLTRLIPDLSMARFNHGENNICFADECVRSTDRTIGTYLAGALTGKYRQPDSQHKAILRLGASVPGNGIFAFGSADVEVIVAGCCQTGAAKGSMGG